ncbi:MAG: hypothetical protein HYV63_06640 [Candidatus Schekmanbacteria bacterium]|nr:hypothetical protein [Candidatus Schekmanbacteria bacterium]
MIKSSSGSLAAAALALFFALPTVPAPAQVPEPTPTPPIIPVIPDPVVTSVSRNPAVAQHESSFSFTIFGRNFAVFRAGASRLQFVDGIKSNVLFAVPGQVGAAMTSWSDSRIAVTVPASAFGVPACYHPIRLRVVTSDAATAVSPDTSISVMPAGAPSIQALSLSPNPATVGQVSPAGTLQASVWSWSSSAVAARVPAASLVTEPAKDVSLRLLVSDLAGETSAYATTTLGVKPKKPVVSSFSATPNHAHTTDAITIAITGTSFGTKAGAVAIDPVGAAFWATVVTWSNSLIKVAVPGARLYGSGGYQPYHVEVYEGSVWHGRSGYSVTGSYVFPLPRLDGLTITNPAPPSTSLEVGQPLIFELSGSGSAPPSGPGTSPSRPAARRAVPRSQRMPPAAVQTTGSRPGRTARSGSRSPRRPSCGSRAISPCTTACGSTRFITCRIPTRTARRRRACRFR